MVTIAPSAREAVERINRLAYSPGEAARATGLSRATIYNLLAAGQLASVKAGRRRLILAEELTRFLSNLPAA